MIVLHGALATDGVWLWGESRSGDPDLVEALAKIGLAKPLRAEPVVAWLPTSAGVPIASSPLIADPPPPKARTSIAPWTLRAGRLTTAETVDLLARCIGKDALAAGVFVGPDLAFAATALQFAAGLVVRHQYVPDVEEQAGTYRAAWLPVLEGPDAERFTALVRAMPGASRALGTEATHPPAVSPADLLRSFVAALVDHLVRAANPEEAGTAKRDRTFDSLHEQWIHALRSPDGTLLAAPAELARFERQVREWHRPVTAAADAPFRLTFRLEEPAATEHAATGNGGGGPWKVRYLLQAVHDPSLLVSADDVWNDRARRALRRPGFDAKEHLLGSLGQAARIDPHIDASLRQHAPAQYETDASGAFEFLSRSSIGLEQAGFGVLLPRWWTRKGTRGRLTIKAVVATPKLKGESGLGLDQLVKFDWKVALGGSLLTRAELEDLARLKTPLVRVRGQWVHVSAQEIQAALRFWKEKGRTATVRDVVRLALGVPGLTPSLPFDGVEATGWVGDLLRQARRPGRLRRDRAAPGLARHAAAVPGPRLLVARVPRPVGLRGLPGRRHGPRQDGPDAGPHRRGTGRADRRGRPCSICPTSVVGNWQKEAERFTPDLPRAGPSRRRTARRRPSREAAGRTPSSSRATRCCTATWTR